MLWNPEWTDRWYYYPDGRRARINPLKHLIHSLGNTPGIDVGVYAYWKRHGIQTLRFAFKPGMTLPDGSIGLVAALVTFDLVKAPYNAGNAYGEQWAAPIDAAGVWHPVWSAEDAEATIAELLTLAYGAA